MNRAMMVVAILVVALIVIAAEAAYTVPESQQAVVTQFGEIVGEPISEPGLHFKTPFLQKVNRFEKRWLEWDGEANQITTSDKRYIYVDVYARWRIADPILFFQRLRNELSAHSRLDDIIDGTTRNVIANHDLIEVVRTSNRDFEDVLDTKAIEDQAEPGEGAPADQDSTPGAPEQVDIEVGREAIAGLILEVLKPEVAKLGIEVVDVRVKRINYIESVQAKVYERMISERKQVADAYRSQGRGLAAEIRGKLDKDLKKITSEAYRQAEEIKGAADAEAARIYAEAYEQDPELYRFLKTLESYRRTMDGNAWLLLGTDADYAGHLRRMKPKK
jgi:modulator of FtsH protease HflC